MNTVYNGTEGDKFVVGYNDAEFEKGLGVHPKPGKVESYTFIDISAYTDPAGIYQCNTMYSLIGLTNDTGKTGSSPGVRFLIYADYTGEGSVYTLIAKSGDVVMKNSGEFNIDVTGVKVLKLVVVTITDNHASSSSGWVDACLFKADENAVKPDYTPDDPGPGPGDDTDPANSSTDDNPLTEEPKNTGTSDTGTTQVPENNSGCKSAGGFGAVLLLSAAAVLAVSRKRRLK